MPFMHRHLRFMCSCLLIGAPTYANITLSRQSACTYLLLERYVRHYAYILARLIIRKIILGRLEINSGLPQGQTSSSLSVDCRGSLEYMAFTDSASPLGERTTDRTRHCAVSYEYDPSIRVQTMSQNASCKARDDTGTNINIHTPPLHTK